MEVIQTFINDIFSKIPIDGLQHIPWYGQLFLIISAISFFVIYIPKITKPFQKQAGEKAAEGRKDFCKNPTGSTLTKHQIQAMQVGAISGEQIGNYIDSLETGVDVEVLKEGIEEYWSIFDRESALETLEWLKDEGHRPYYKVIHGLLLSTNKTDKQHQKIQAQFEEGDRDKAMEYLNHLRETIPTLKKKDGVQDIHFQKGILAYDMGRMVAVARMCYDLGYIDREETLNYIDIAYRNCKSLFLSWEELAKSHLIGRAMWSGNSMGFDGIKVIVKNLLTKNKSPWKLIQF